MIYVIERFNLMWESMERSDKKIPYINWDGAERNYFADFLIQNKYVVEIKPKKQCKEPIKKKRITKSYISEIKAWVTNTAKWAAATEESKKRGWEFKILTEDDLFRKS